MAKRRADKQYTPDNWDDEEPAEEPGHFAPASQDVLANRVIRKAKRTLPASGETGSKPSPFTGFTFGKTNGTTTTGASTAFGSTQVTSSATQSNGGNTLPTGMAGDSGYSEEYLAKVAQLNKEILTCITKFVEQSGYFVNMNPSFEDYAKHFKELENEERERQKKNNNAEGQVEAGFSSQSKSPFSKFSFGAPKPSTGATNSTTEPEKKPGTTSADPKPFTFGAPAPVNESPKSGFKFGATPSSPTSLPDKPAATSVFGGTSTSPASFTFGVKTPEQNTTSNSSPKSFGTPGTPSSGFSFGLPKPVSGGFTFNVAPPTTVPAPTTTTTEEAAGNDEDAPPVVDVAPVDEEGALYTKKIKLFFKKQQADEKGLFGDKGVGYLHIKKLDGDGHQLIVRSHDKLGNIYLNVRLDKNTPIGRVGKNNVSLGCVPNPPLSPKEEPKPTTFLIRVKTSEEADELKDKLIEFKSS